MKKTACAFFTIILFLAGTSVFAMQKWFLSDYIRWYENEDVANLLYNEYKTGYDEGYDKGREYVEKEKSRSFSKGRNSGIAETEEKYEAKYKGFAPWWTNLITGISVAVVCSGVFLIIWIVKKKKTVSFPLKANPPIEVQDQSVQLKNPFIEAKEALKERMPK